MLKMCIRKITFQNKTCIFGQTLFLCVSFISLITPWAAEVNLPWHEATVYDQHLSDKQQKETFSSLMRQRDLMKSFVVSPVRWAATTNRCFHLLLFKVLHFSRQHAQTFILVSDSPDRTVISVCKVCNEVLITQLWPERYKDTCSQKSFFLFK